MEYLSVLVGLLFTPCRFKLGFYGACKDIFKHFDDGSHDIFGTEFWEKWGGVGWGEFSQFIIPIYSTNSYLIAFIDSFMQD